MFSEEVTNKDGVVKNVVASSEAELAEAVESVKAEQSETTLDINNPDDANKVVSPGATHAQAAEEVAAKKFVSTARPRPVVEDEPVKDTKEDVKEAPKKKPKRIKIPKNPFKKK